MQPQAKQSAKEDEQCQVEDHILKKFELLEFKGKGAYGVVWKAVDRKTKQIVALKKIFDAFHNATDSQRTFREVIFLEQLNNHENIIKLTSVIKAENNKDLYMVFDYMETDLHKVIRANILEPIHKKYIVYQVLKGLKYLHTGEVIHRDLKPSNLLINSECKVKVADFGLARSVAKPDDNTNPILTEYVATRWYRAPEILLGSQYYSKAVDMWSLGCIVGEMIVGKAIFPGTSTLNQIERIIELCGRPKPEDLEAIQAPLAEQVLQSINTQKKKSFAQYFSAAPEDAIDFLRKTLVYNPTKRMTVEQALEHRYIKEFKNTEEESKRDSPLETLMNDNHKYSIKEYQNALYNRIVQKKRIEHKSLIIRNPNNGSVNLSVDKSTSPTKKESSIIKKDPETSNIDNEFQHPGRALHQKSQSYSQGQYLQRKTTSQEDIQFQVSTHQSPTYKKQQQMFPMVDSNSPINKGSRKSSLDKKLQSTLTAAMQATLSQQQFSRKGSQGSISKTNVFNKSTINTQYNSLFQKKK
ncbi:unnamed protein product [Paramecium pentaurelia]|uniref:mitogen-activated protein kinase n=1 Tax=Paramecium pentaurelia TaxID=43138 RepID=A0A8S1Y788_9CILI|nr:unnamed protein product [Paramecium pentaurelia]